MFNFLSKNPAFGSFLLPSTQQPNDQVTTNPAEIRKLEMDFYTNLFSKATRDEAVVAELLQLLPQLTSEDQETSNTDLALEELTTAVTQMSSGRSPGIVGLPADFFKHLLGKDIFDVFKDSFVRATLAASCQQGVLSLLPKKGVLAPLKNWRPVTLLCADYKILLNVLSNRCKKFIDLRIQSRSVVLCSWQIYVRQFISYERYFGFMQDI